MRAIQRLEEKRKHKIAANEDAGEASPYLTEWLGSEMQKEAMVAKERRKAREERALSRKNEGKPDAQK